MGKPRRSSKKTKQTACYLFIKSHSLCLSGEQLWWLLVCRWKKNAPPQRMERLWSPSLIISNPGLEVSTSHAERLSALYFFLLSLDPLKDELKLFWDYLFVFPFFNSYLSLLTRKTFYRIYEKTHVDLCNLFKPEGMHILFVKLTFLLSLIGITRGKYFQLH